MPGACGVCAIIPLLYDARDVEEHPIAPIGGTVREFVLIHSLRGHVHLAR